jgi:hypothetical protein
MIKRFRKLLQKENPKIKWNNKEYPIDNVPLNTKIVSLTLNKFWKD